MTGMSALEGPARAAEELAGAHREQGAVARPHAALAGDEAAARARRARLRVEPRFLGPRPVERNREVDAGGDVVALDVQPNRGGPAECVDQDQGTARVDPRVVERRTGHEAIPIADHGRTRSTMLPVVDPGGRAL